MSTKTMNDGDMMVHIIQQHPGITATEFCAKMRELGAAEGFTPELLGMPADQRLYAGVDAPKMN